MSVNFNPYVTTNAAGSFNVSSQGFVAGTLLDNPPDLYRIAGGTVASTETLPMFGGVGISEAIPGATGTPDPSLGSIISRATAIGSPGTAGSLTGFAIFNQAHAMFNTPQSPVPVSNNGGVVDFVRLGSGVRIALPIDPALVSLNGSIITSQVSWDFTNQLIVAFATNALPVKILKVDVGNSMVPSYNSGTGFVSWNRSGSTAVVLI